MKRTRNPNRKLELRKERLRELTTEEHQRVVGGAQYPTIEVHKNTSKCVTTAN